MVMSSKMVLTWQLFKRLGSAAGQLTHCRRGQRKHWEARDLPEYICHPEKKLRKEEEALGRQREDQGGTFGQKEYN